MLTSTDLFYKASRFIFLMQDSDVTKGWITVTLSFYWVLVHGLACCIIRFTLLNKIYVFHLLMLSPALYSYHLPYIAQSKNICHYQMAILCSGIFAIC